MAVPSSLQHLTPEERKAVKERLAEEALQKIATSGAAKRAKAAARRRAKRQGIIEASKIPDKEPPVDLVRLFGPQETALPNEIRPVDEIPWQKLKLKPEDEVPLDDFIEEVAKQPHFKESVGEAIADPRIARFLKLIGQVKNKSMSWCAAACGLTRGDLAKIWRDGTLAQAFFRIVKRMPSLADKVVDDAMGNMKSCPRCDGFGRIDVPLSMREFFDDQETTICPSCEGRKTVSMVGSAPDRQLIFEKIGWVKQKGGVNVNISMGEHSIDSTMSEMEGIEGQVLEHQP